MEFIVEGTPQGKARPRFSKKSGTVYTPAKTAKYEKLIRKAFLGAGGKAIPSDCYVGITVDAYFQIPKSYTTWGSGWRVSIISIARQRNRTLIIH